MAIISANNVQIKKLPGQQYIITQSGDDVSI